MCLVEHSNQHRRNAYLGILKPAPVSPVVIGLVVLVRWLQGRMVFTEDGRLLRFGQSREKVFTLRVESRYKLWLIRQRPKPQTIKKS